MSVSSTTAQSIAQSTNVAHIVLGDASICDVRNTPSVPLSRGGRVTLMYNPSSRHPSSSTDTRSRATVPPQVGRALVMPHSSSLPLSDRLRVADILPALEARLNSHQISQSAFVTGMPRTDPGIHTFPWQSCKTDQQSRTVLIEPPSVSTHKFIGVARLV